MRSRHTGDSGERTGAEHKDRGQLRECDWWRMWSAWGSEEERKREARWANAEREVCGIKHDYLEWERRRKRWDGRWRRKKIYIPRLFRKVKRCCNYCNSTSEGWKKERWRIHAIRSECHGHPVSAGREETKEQNCTWGKRKKKRETAGH